MRAAVRVPSLTAPGVSYRVETLASGRLACECARAGFLKAGEECRHMGLARRADALLAKCAERHGLQLVLAGADIGAGTPPQPAVCRQCLVELLALVAGKVRREYVTKDAAKAKVAAARKRRTRRSKVGLTG